MVDEHIGKLAKCITNTEQNVFAAAINKHCRLIKPDFVAAARLRNIHTNASFTQTESVVQHITRGWHQIITRITYKKYSVNAFFFHINMGKQIFCRLIAQIRCRIILVSNPSV